MTPPMDLLIALGASVTIRLATYLLHVPVAAKSSITRGWLFVLAVVGPFLMGAGVARHVIDAGDTDSISIALRVLSIGGLALLLSWFLSATPGPRWR